MKAQDNITNSQQANRNREITIWIFGLVFSTLLFVNSSAFAGNLEFEEESYIDDIPFSTELVVANYYYKIALSANIDFEDENYIDDIPFNTELVSDRIAYTKAINVHFEMEDENYIDDIPFDTFSIANRKEAASSQYAFVK